MRVTRVMSAKSCWVKVRCFDKKERRREKRFHGQLSFTFFGLFSFLLNFEFCVSHTNSPPVLIETHIRRNTNDQKSRKGKPKTRGGRRRPGIYARQQEQEQQQHVINIFSSSKKKKKNIIKKSWHRRTTRIRARKRTKENPSLALSGDASPRVERCFQTHTRTIG